MRDKSAANKDLEVLSNCVERHVCRPTGYFKSTQLGQCRFRYPKELQAASDLVFEEKSGGTVVAKVVLRRNDEFLNPFCAPLLQAWRANMDLQIVVDVDACVRYLVKNATKAEKELWSNLQANLCQQQYLKQSGK